MIQPLHFTDAVQSVLLLHIIITMGARVSISAYEIQTYLSVIVPNIIIATQSIFGVKCEHM